MIAFLCSSGFANNVNFHCQLRGLGPKETEEIRRMQKIMNNKIDSRTLAGRSPQDSTRLTVHDRQSKKNDRTLEGLAAGSSAFGRL
jgi:hypothetical protein